MSNLSNHLLKRKTYPEVMESLENKSRELFGDDINLSQQGPLGMFLQVVGWEISNAWEELENSYLNGSLLTAEGQNLDFVINNWGRERFDGTKAKGTIKITGDNDTLIEKGFIVATKGDYMYSTLEDVTIKDGVAVVGIEALNIGTEYNVPIDTITEIVNPILGVYEVTNQVATTGGTPVETDAEYRARQYLANIEPVTGSNVAQYRQWALDVKGVGSVKVLPITPTPGYTTLIITDRNNQPASDELVQEVTDYITPLKDVNAGLYVYSAIAKNVKVTSKVALLEGYNLQDVETAFNANLQSYFTSIALTAKFISYAQVGRILLETEGVLDYQELLLNDTSNNLPLEDREVPVLTETRLEV